MSRHFVAVVLTLNLECFCRLVLPSNSLRNSENHAKASSCCVVDERLPMMDVFGCLMEPHQKACAISASLL